MYPPTTGSYTLSLHDALPIWPIDDPDVVVAIGGDAGDLAEQPVARQVLGPERIDLELRHACFRGLCQHRSARERQQRARHQDRSCLHRILPLLLVCLLHYATWSLSNLFTKQLAARPPRALHRT